MFVAILLTTALVAGESQQAGAPFVVTVVDAETGRGVPLVELRTVHGVRCYTDSSGVVAFAEPGLMGQDVFFYVASHGYEFPKDGFGFRGKTLRVTPGGKERLTIKRVNLAERLYRVTGGGIYRDSVLAGLKSPIEEPLLNGQVLGSDSVVNAVYRDKIYWFWGDTNRPSYPLGIFHVPGAVSELPARGGLDPEVGIDLRYFLDDRGFAKATAAMPGKGPTWLTTLIPLRDQVGRERLCASYVKVEPPLKVYARGLAEFDDAQQAFERVREVDMQAVHFPAGHAFAHREGGEDFVYFAHPFPLVRVRATMEDFLHVDRYEAFTCLKEGSRVEDGQLDREADGRLRYAWRKSTPALNPGDEARLFAAGKIQASELRWQLRDRETGKQIRPHAGSVYWNAFRRRWVMIAVQTGGASFLGEVWYAEADTPVGPWAYAVKVVTHERYSFYNPKQHPFFDKEGGKTIFFEGTYSHTFSGNSEATPRYDYNQILYKLDLANPRVALPVAVYDDSAKNVPVAFATGFSPERKAARPAFFALDRPFPGGVPILPESDGLRVGRPEDKGAVFYAWPADAKEPPAATTPLYAYRPSAEGRRAYSVDPALPLAGFSRVQEPLCRVWRAPN
jgi:hypothetical protein